MAVDSGRSQLDHGGPTVCLRTSDSALRTSLQPCALCLVAFPGASALIAVTLAGPVSLASLSLPWALTFMAALVALVLWWTGYLALLRGLGGWAWPLGLRRSRWLLGILSTAWLPTLATVLSGKLSYTLVFNPDTRSLYLWLAAAVLGATVAGQEAMLLGAARGETVGQLARGGTRWLGRLPIRMARLPVAIAGHARHHPFPAMGLLVVLAVGTVQRLAVIGEAHAGDMGVLLSVTYATLSWPPFGYYEAYRPQPWVYNHFPLFPMMLAPIYWFFENVLLLPTVMAAKMLIGFADLLVALLLYTRARGRWRWTWGLTLAAAWLLAPWVLGADDHPMGPAVAFALGAMATLHRGWLAGALLALGAATRNEVAFLVMPVALHFVARRGLAQSTAFFGAFGTTLALVIGPFAITDFEALDYAVRRHTEEIGSAQLSTVLAFLLPWLDQGVGTLLRQKQELLAIGLNLLVALLALRDPRPLRVVVVVAATYLLTLPVIHPRYTLFLFGTGLLYAGRYRSPLVGAAGLAAVWPEFVYSLHALLALPFGLALVGIRGGPRRTDSNRKDEGDQGD